MKNWLLFSALICLSGCASPPSCQYGAGVAPAEHCRTGELLYQNDMLQAKLLISQADPQTYELIQAMLRRAALQDASGEAEFYQAVLLIREQGNPDDVIDLLRSAARQRHPLAIALLARQLMPVSPDQSEHWHTEYAGLDVAKSGYPSFEQAQEVINGLLRPPIQSTHNH